MANGEIMQVKEVDISKLPVIEAYLDIQCAATPDLLLCKAGMQLLMDFRKQAGN